MKIVIDSQGLQCESRFRGIGRYSMELTQALCRISSSHEFVLALNGAFRDTIEPIRALFEKNLSLGGVKVFEIASPIAEKKPENSWRIRASEVLRNWFLKSLEPDWLLVTSLFEGWGDDTCVSVPEKNPGYRTAVILYDLIPFIHPEQCFVSPFHRSWYERKLDSLKRADLLLAISDATRQDGIDLLGLHQERIVTIGGGIEGRFHPIKRSVDARRELQEKYGLWEKFVLYVPGGFDWRKNFDTLFLSFSRLPREVREFHQLVIPGKLPEGNKKHLVEKAEELGIRHNILLPGYVSDEDLINFYNDTTLFIYPSLYEGFGLPLLEAIACGAPAIASNTTSIPEILSYERALFNPRDPESLSEKILEFLINDNLRKGVVQYGLEQIGQFSWNKVASRTLDALENFFPHKRAERWITVSDSGLFQQKRKRFLILKLDHRGDFLLALPALKKLRAKYPTAVIDLLVASWNQAIAETLGLANSVFVFDFFQSQSSFSPLFKKEDFEALLRHMGPYDVAIDFRRQRETRHLLLKINARLKVGYRTHDDQIDSALDIALDSESDQPGKVIRHNLRSASLQMMDLVDALGNDVSDFVEFPEIVKGNWDKTGIAVFPFAGNPIKEWGIENFESLIGVLSDNQEIDIINLYCSEKETSSISSGIRGNPKVICHAGLGFQELVDSLRKNDLAVANNSFGAHVSSFVGLKTVIIFGGHERVEEWGPVFGKGHRILHVDLPCSPCHLPGPKDCTHGMECLTRIDTQYVAKNVLDMLDLSKKNNLDEKKKEASERPEKLDRKSTVGMFTPLEGEPWLERFDVFAALDSNQTPSDRDLRTLARSIVLNHPQRKHKELFVDVSELARVDAKSGIQRVVRSILEEWIEHPPNDFVVQPVYLSNEGGDWHYRYARRFSCSQGWQIQNSSKPDFVVDPLENDLLFAPDLSPFPVIHATRSGMYDTWRSRGVNLFFLIHDLLPILHPEWFPKGASDSFQEWLECVARVSTGLICNSHSTEKDLRDWLSAHPLKRVREVSLSVVHLGGNFITKAGECDVSDQSGQAFATPNSGTTFLMVGTLEPRKGHEQVLLGFDRLWKAGMDVNLIIVGKQGWKVKKLAKAIQSHSEFGKKLFWMKDLDDRQLDKIYRKVHGLIMASKGEGFGLPLVEAVQRKIPVITRDLPVFREILGDHALYFSGETGESLSEAILNWIDLKEACRLPNIGLARVLTWQESAQRFLSAICTGHGFVGLR